MIDKYEREINYLRVSVTDRCNLRCKYCMPPEGIPLLEHANILSYEELIRIVTVATTVGIKKVRVTGGEPLIRSQITDFLAELNAIPALEDISLTTNGILLYEKAPALRDAGIKRINISLDSLDAGKYAEITRGGDLNRVLRGIERAAELGFSPIKINIVAIHGFNDDEITDFAELTRDYPYQIRFIEFMPMGDSAVDENFAYLSNDTIRETIKAELPLKPAHLTRRKTDGPADIYRIDGARGTIGFISAFSHHFCATCNRLRVTADGHLRPCLFSDYEIDLRVPLRNGCSDDELARLMRTAIERKPVGITGSFEAHRKKCAKNMVSIGG